MPKQCYTQKSTRFRDVHKPIPRADCIPICAFMKPTSRVC